MRSIKQWLAPAVMVVALAACETPYQATDSTVGVTTPATVQSSFTTQYPNAGNVVWTSYDATSVPIDWELSEWSAMDNGDYVVRFDLDNENYYAWYDDAGTWVGSAHIVRDFNTLPSSVTTAAKNKYPDHTISTVNREFRGDKMVYEVTMKNTDDQVMMIVDNDGKILREKNKAMR